MRIVYLDEAGISSPAQEPYLVVAGVLIDGDRDWPKAQEELESLAKKYDLKSIFDFHAKDIFHGNGLFDRRDSNWPLDRRRELLLDLASIPARCAFPVVTGFIERKSFQRAYEEREKRFDRILPNREHNKPKLHLLAYGEAFVDAVRAADYWLEVNAASERGIIIVEDSPQIRGDLKLIQSVFQYRDLRTHIVFLKVRPFKAQRIIETVHFAGKRDSPLLQLADICAFVIKRRLMKRSDVEDCYRAIEPQIVRTQKTKMDSDIWFQEMRDAIAYIDEE